ncbi:MAG: beta-hydroxyacyl-ACP dehydratase [Planctomycetota bacterium]
MRWFLIDRYTEFISGERATALKGITLSEDATDEYAPGRNYLPSALIIEGLAQTAGLLVAQPSDFLDRVVLAKIQSSKFHFEAYPGNTLTYNTVIERSDATSAFVTGTSHCGDELQAEVKLMFAKLKDDNRFQNVELFEPAELCRMCRQLRIFEVGVYPDGSPVQVPERMLEAEKALLLKR